MRELIFDFSLTRRPVNLIVGPPPLVAMSTLSLSGVYSPRPGVQTPDVHLHPRGAVPPLCFRSPTYGVIEPTAMTVPRPVPPRRVLCLDGIRTLLRTLFRGQ